MTDDGRGEPLVAFASTVQFAPGERLGFARVESRMLLAGVSGQGQIVVNGRRLDLTPQMIMVMPWGHSVQYLPDEADPYLVYGAHLIPRHADTHPVELTVPHYVSHPLAGVDWRSDAELGIGADLWLSDDESHPTLKTLLKLVAQVWDRGTPSVTTAHALGVLVVSELAVVDQILPHNDPRLPVRLRKIVGRMLADPSRVVSVADLAAFGGCSAATLTRMFRDHLHLSPMAWVQQIRIDAAKELLVTTSLPMSQIARRVGISDAYYFSRQFHQHTQMSPSAWRRRWAAP